MYGGREILGSNSKQGGRKDWVLWSNGLDQTPAILSSYIEIGKFIDEKQ